MMFLPDVNVLLYPIDSSAPQHAPCRDWLTDALNGEELVGWSWTVLLAFVRLGTNPTVLDTPLTMAEAFDYVDEWLAQPPSDTDFGRFSGLSWFRPPGQAHHSHVVGRKHRDGEGDEDQGFLTSDEAPVDRASKPFGARRQQHARDALLGLCRGVECVPLDNGGLGG
jgi:hypothetical protein